MYVSKGKNGDLKWSVHSTTVHLFNKYLINTYCVPGHVIDTSLNSSEYEPKSLLHTAYILESDYSQIIKQGQLRQTF